MDVQLVHSSAGNIQHGQLLCVTCLSHASICYRVSGCPCIALSVREAHVSFIQRQTDRYLVLISNSQAEKLKNVAAPCTVRVNNAADFWFDDNASDGAIEPCLATLIMDLTVEPSLPGPLPRHRIPPSVALPGMPHVKKEDKCNCNMTGSINMVIVQVPMDTNVPSSEQQNKDSPIDDLCRLQIKVKGSTYNKAFQKALGLARQAGPNAAVNFIKEPDNPVDHNALAITVPGIEAPRQIGYVGGSWLRAMSNALSDIHSASISKITRHLHSKVIPYYMAEVTILKRGRWLKEDCDYKYNDNIDK